MLHACVVDCPPDAVAALRASPKVTGVWADSVSPAMSVATSATTGVAPSDPRPIGVEHHRASFAHQSGFTGAGSSSWAPVAAVLDGWLLGEFGSVQRHHAGLHQGGSLSQSTRVLADLDWNTPATPLPMRPLPAPGVGTTNLYHGLGIAGVLAGAATNGPNLFSFAPGHAPGAGLVAMNILASLPPTTPQAPCLGFPADPTGYLAYQSPVLGGLNTLSALLFTYTGTGPVVTSVSPASGPVTGGTVVTIKGTGFTGATSVSFGGTAASSYTVICANSITAIAPAHSAGAVYIVVTTGAGGSPQVAASQFTFTGTAGTVSYTLTFRWTLLTWVGIDGISVDAAVEGLESPDIAATNDVSGRVTAIFLWDSVNQRWQAWFPNASNIPGANDFSTFRQGRAYFIAINGSGSTTWVVIAG